MNFIKKNKYIKIVIVVIIILCALFIPGILSKDSKATNKNINTFITLGDYKGIEYTKADYDVTDKVITDRINSVLEEYTETKDVTNRAVKDKDVVNIDFTGYIDGVKFDGGSATGKDLEIGSKSFIDTFETQLIGKKLGQEVDVNVTFPADYQNAELAGKKALFKVKINKIQEKIIPTLTNDFVKEKFKFNTVEDFKNDVKATLILEKQSELDYYFKSTILKKSNVLEYPSKDLEFLIKEMTSQYESLAAQYNMDLSTFLNQSYGMSLSDFNARVKDMAKERVGHNLVLRAISVKENITLNDSEYDSILKQYLSLNNYDSVDQLKKYYSDDEIRQELIYQKTLNFIKENAKEV